jgi:hypothetical protein
LIAVVDGRGATINIIAGNQYNNYGGGIPYAPLWYVPMYHIPAYSMVSRRTRLTVILGLNLLYKIYQVSQGAYLVEYYSTLVYRAPLAAIDPPLLHHTVYVFTPVIMCSPIVY